MRTRGEQVFINYWRQRGSRALVESANPDYRPIDLPLTEIAGAWPVVQTLIWALGIAVVFMPLAIRAYRRKV